MRSWLDEAPPRKALSCQRNSVVVIGHSNRRVRQEVGDLSPCSRRDTIITLVVAAMCGWGCCYLVFLCIFWHDSFWLSKLPRFSFISPVLTAHLTRLNHTINTCILSTVCLYRCLLLRTLFGSIYVRQHDWNYSLTVLAHRLLKKQKKYSPHHCINSSQFIYPGT